LKERKEVRRGLYRSNISGTGRNHRHRERIAKGRGVAASGGGGASKVIMMEGDRGGSWRAAVAGEVIGRGQ